MTYLDWAATAVPDKEILTAAAGIGAENFANPSSSHSAGKASRAALEEMRNRCAAVLDCDPGALIFTAGGTESNNLVLMSRLRASGIGEIIISGFEHASVREPAEALASMGGKLTVIDPTPDGTVEPERIAGAISENTRMVAVMGVNNEIGAIQPLSSIAEVLRDAEKRTERRIHFHSDLVQAAGKMPLRLSELDVDSASFSAHKIRGPRGTGLLYLPSPRIEALYRGGGQERGFRPGTESLAGAAGIAMALERYGAPSEKAAKTGAYLVEALAGIPGAQLLPRSRHTRPETFVPGIVSVAFPPVPAEVLERVLSEQGYAVSRGSACNRNKRRKSSHTLKAIGVPEKIAGSMIRISIGALTTEDQIDGFIAELKDQVEILSRAVR